MIVSITNEIITKLKTEIPNLTILREYPQTTPKFPCVIISEGDLEVDIGTLDSGGYQYNNYEITFDLYTIDDGTFGKIEIANKLRVEIDNILSGEYGLQRIGGNPIPNLGDVNIYRYRMTYIGKLDKNKTIYRR